MSKKAIHNTVAYNKVELERIQLSELNENDRIPSQKIAYIRYDDPKKGENQFDIQTPEFLLDNYGIPDGDGPFYPTVKSRAFVKLPLDINENVENETSEEREERKTKLAAYKEFLINLDKFFESKKDDIFGKKNSKKYEYQPIVRQAKVMDDDDDDDSEEGEPKVEIKKPDYMKTKVPLNYGSDNIETDIYRKNKEGSEEFKTDGKYTKLEIEGLDDMRNHVKYMRKMKFVMHLSKLWASKQATNGADTKKFGVTFKLSRVEVQQRGEPKQEIVESNDVPFIDSDDDDDDVKEVKKVAELTLNEEDEEDEEESEESEEESEDLPPPPPKAKKSSRSKKA